MKKVLLYSCITLLSLTVFGSVAFLFAEEYFQAQFMSPSKAEKKWGTTPFDATKFREGSAAMRAPMAVDIVKRHLYVGEDRAKVREELGGPDGYFFSDTIFAYQIERPTEAKTEAWQIVFIPDDNLDKVRSVKIHKKCCYSDPPWIND